MLKTLSLKSIFHYVKLFWGDYIEKNNYFMFIYCTVYISMWK